MAPPLTDVSAVANAQLKSQDGSVTTASDLWKEKPVCILILRRPGCVLCRAESKKIWSNKEEFEKTGVRLVCVLHQWLPAEVAAFAPEYWGGELYLDVDKVFYKALGGGQVKRGSVLTFLNPFSEVWKRGKEAKKVVNDSNMTGDGLTMGGLMVIKPGSDKISFIHVEENFGDHASQEEVLEACRKASQK